MHARLTGAAPNGSSARRGRRRCSPPSTRTATPTADEESHAHELLFSLRFLDAIADDDREADRQLARLAATIPASGRLAVQGGVEGETLKPLDIVPAPNTPISRYLAAGIVEADLDRLAAGQQADGGWSVDFVSRSPAATIEWRGLATLEALAALRAYGRLG